MIKYEVMFYYGVHHVNPFLKPSKVIEIEVNEKLGENEIVARALLKLKEDTPRTYSTRVRKLP